MTDSCYVPNRGTKVQDVQEYLHVGSRATIRVMNVAPQLDDDENAFATDQLLHLREAIPDDLLKTVNC
jgi:hypothetical protein